MQSFIQYSSTGGVRLDGLFEEANSPRRAALLLHGLGSSKEEPVYPLLGGGLARAGVSSFRFDFRGHGKSSGKSEEMTIQGEVDDLAASMKLVRERWQLPVSILAASFGAAVTLAYLEQCGAEGVESLVLLNPLLDFERTFLKPELPWAKKSFHAEGLRSLEEKGYLVIDGTFRMGKAAVEEMKTVWPYETLSALTIPVLTIHGDRDTFVSYEIASQYGAPNPRSCFVTVPGAEHGFGRPEETRQVVDTVLEWFAELS